MATSTQSAEPAAHPLADLLRVLGKYGIVVVFVVLLVVLGLMSSAFFTPRNITNVLAQTAPLGIIACGAALVIIAGGFDLSVGAIYSFSGVVAALTANASGAPAGIVVGLAAGLVLGLLNGAVITIFGINSFIATLASGMVFAGATAVLTGGFLIPVQADGYDALGNARIWSIPVPVFIFAAVAVVSGIVLAYGKFGRYVYASGGNAEAARLSGVRVDGVRIITFGISGLCAALAGVIASSRVSTGQADAGIGIELTVIAAVVVGGISISGGEGSIWRAVLGVLLVALIGNGFNILNVDPFYQQLAQGFIILIAVAFDARSGGLIHQYWHRLRRAVSRRSRNAALAK